MSAADCGSYSGYRAHRTRGEAACRPCKDAAAAYERDRRKARMAARALGEVIPGPGRPAGKTSAVEHFLAEVEHLADAGAGWGRICAAFGASPVNLEKRLMNHGRADLAARVFGQFRYEITQKDRRAA